MSKSIKVSEEVYTRLLAQQRPRETFSNEVKRLLDNWDAVLIMVSTVEALPDYQRWRQKPGEQVHKID